MYVEQVNAAIELIARALELVGVAAIALAFAYALVRGLFHLGRRLPDAYDRVKKFIGKSLLLGLEFLVAADIIRTVAVTPTAQSVAVLAGIVAIRTFLSFSLQVEMTGSWPWQRPAKPVGDGQPK